jgi:hypothetical protein
MEFHPDGTKLATIATSGFSDNSNDNTNDNTNSCISVWDASTCVQLLSLPALRCCDISFSSDGARLAAAGDSAVDLWNWAAQELLLTYKLHSLRPFHAVPGDLKESKTEGNSEVNEIKIESNEIVT